MTTKHTVGELTDEQMDNYIAGITRLARLYDHKAFDTDDMRRRFDLRDRGKDLKTRARELEAYDPPEYL